MRNLGDLPRGQTLVFPWTTVSQAGASIAPSVPGTLVVYRGNNTTEFTTGVTDTRAFDALVGFHLAQIDTSDQTKYIPGNDFIVALQAATIDGQAVNAALGFFSIENRTGEISRKTAGGVAAQAITLAAGDGGADQSRQGCIVEAFTAATSGAQQKRTIISNVGDVCALDRPWAPQPVGTLVYKLYAGSLGLKLTEISGQIVTDEAAHAFDAAGTTVEQLRKAMIAVLSGKTDGPLPGVAGTLHCRDVADGKNVVTGTVDISGYRTAVTFDFS